MKRKKMKATLRLKQQNGRVSSGATVTNNVTRLQACAGQLYRSNSQELFQPQSNIILYEIIILYEYYVTLCFYITFFPLRCKKRNYAVQCYNNSYAVNRNSNFQSLTQILDAVEKRTLHSIFTLFSFQPAVLLLSCPACPPSLKRFSENGNVIAKDRNFLRWLSFFSRHDAMVSRVVSFRE